MKVKVAQLCLTLCDSRDYTVQGILQARTLEWVAFPFSRGSSQPRDQTQKSPALQEDSLPAEPQGKPEETVLLPKCKNYPLLHLSGLRSLSHLLALQASSLWGQGSEVTSEGVTKGTSRPLRVSFPQELAPHLF